MQERLPAVVQPRFVSQGGQQDVQALPERVVAEVGEASLRARLAHHLDGGDHDPPCWNVVVGTVVKEQLGEA
jgi:hypothetical protein